MHFRITGIVCLAGALTCSALAESAASAQWAGVWQGKLDGQPSVTLTLAHDTGRLSGTLVLNIIMKKDGKQAYIAAVEPHALVNPRVEANTLYFDVRRIDGDLMNFTVALTPEGRARIHCTNCGKGAPTVDMDRAQ